MFNVTSPKYMCMQTLIKRQFLNLNSSIENKGRGQTNVYSVVMLQIKIDPIYIYIYIYIYIQCKSIHLKPHGLYALHLYHRI